MYEYNIAFNRSTNSMLKNKASFNYYELVGIFDESSLLNINPDIEIEGVSTDSRYIEPGNMFVAIEGSNIDGHTKIKEAFSNGAIAVLAKKSKVTQEHIEAKYPIVQVEDTIKSLGRMAHYHRNRFKIPVIAIGGSNGKTTTKEMTAQLLSQKYNVLKTYENYNNQIGLPLMLLQFDETYDIAVIEVGTNEPGEISILSEMLAPTDGLITNITEEHLEKLIDLCGVEAEETYLFGYLHKHDGFCFINADDERLIKYAILLENKMTYGFNELADLRVEIHQNDDLTYTLIFNYDTRQISSKLNVIGLSASKNAIAATAIAIKMGLSNDEIYYGLTSYQQPKWDNYGRMLLENISGLKIINDTYNANPASMMSALETLNQFITSTKKIAILGDMLELGDNSKKYHIDILNEAINIADKVYITGELMYLANNGIKSKKSFYFESKDDLINDLINYIEQGDVILVKGSRGMKMEDIIVKLRLQLDSSN